MTKIATPRFRLWPRIKVCPRRWHPPVVTLEKKILGQNAKIKGSAIRRTMLSSHRKPSTPCRRLRPAANPGRLRTLREPATRHFSRGGPSAATTLATKRKCRAAHAANQHDKIHSYFWCAAPAANSASASSGSHPLKQLPPRGSVDISVQGSLITKKSSPLVILPENIAVCCLLGGGNGWG